MEQLSLNDDRWVDPRVKNLIYQVKKNVGALDRCNMLTPEDVREMQAFAGELLMVANIINDILDEEYMRMIGGV